MFILDEGDKNANETQKLHLKGDLVKMKMYSVSLPTGWT